MSIKLMTAVFDSALEKAEKVVALSYADHADDRGKNIFPSIEYMAWKTGYSERSVQRATNALVEKSILIPDGTGPNGTNRWQMIAKNLPERPPFKRGDKMSGGDTVSPGGVTFCHNGGDTVSPKPSVESSVNNHQKDFVPNGTMSPPPPENPKPPKSKPKSDDTAVTEMLAAWGRLFPNKSQPRPVTYRSKIKTRMKSPDFQEHWLVAMERAANSPTCQNESWFQFEFFVRNDENWRKCHRQWMAWKDKQNKTITPVRFETAEDTAAEFARMNGHLPPLGGA